MISRVTPWRIALGVASSLIYPPAFFAKTDELIALAKVAAEYDGMYISHIRNEGGRLLEAFDELITIARGAALPKLEDRPPRNAQGRILRRRGGLRPQNNSGPRNV